jgi:hypothetical protein
MDIKDLVPPFKAGLSPFSFLLLFCYHHSQKWHFPPSCLLVPVGGIILKYMIYFS